MSNTHREGAGDGRTPAPPAKGPGSGEDAPTPTEDAAAEEDVDETSAGGLHYPDEGQAKESKR
ncbi:hypothetical protein [Aurantimonas sp. HBX-1]|uniref:hypothetical protein n=1 Tax=Aurantimonas sp. HBX-1 TaxID=2906072 RepID=UPI001F1C3199|nr:hypothetical protein [Aurantimonas sp. HBX-1]UIJ70785.1 hypothetical protein LXB15_13660 [Aurantimonas sp. HBX-1]